VANTIATDASSFPVAQFTIQRVDVLESGRRRSDGTLVVFVLNVTSAVASAVVALVLVAVACSYSAPSSVAHERSCSVFRVGVSASSSSSGS